MDVESSKRHNGIRCIHRNRPPPFEAQVVLPLLSLWHAYPAAQYIVPHWLEQEPGIVGNLLHHSYYPRYNQHQYNTQIHEKALPAEKKRRV